MEEERQTEQVIAEAPAPTLTLDPFGQGPSPVPEPQLMLRAEDKIAESAQIVEAEDRLTQEEKKMVEDFAAQIDIRDTSTILTYGAATQQKMADFSDLALSNVRTKDMGEIGALLTGVVAELKGFNEEEKESPASLRNRGTKRPRLSQNMTRPRST